VLDASEQDLRREVRRFASESADADIAFVFYAGHGAQVNGENYLLPVDMEVPRTEPDIQLTGLKVDDLVNSIRSTTKIVFLDACRDNPALFKNLVKGRGASAIGLAPTIASNLRQPKPGGGVFIAYATDSGSVALEGESNHSPFTEALLRNLTKAISIDDMFSLVTREVRLITKNVQRPYKYASLESVVCLTGTCSAVSNFGSAVSSPSTEDAAAQANRSIEEELQIALQTKNPDALQAYLERYPDTPKRLEISEKISSLKRAEFNEWTLYQFTSGTNFPHYLQMSSIKPLGDRVAVRHKFPVDRSQPSGTELPDGALVALVAVYDCKRPISAVSETTTVSKSGETLYHYKWADPQFLDLSMGSPLAPGSIGLTAQNIACHEEFRTPLVSKKQLTSMRFSSLSSTIAADGEIFYQVMQNGQSATQDKTEILFIVRFHKERELKFPNPSISGPTYLTEVHRIQLRCTDNKLGFIKSEDYDASNNLVYVFAADPSIETPWKEFVLGSPFALLQRIVCPAIEFGGLGIDVAMDGNLIKVVKVLDGSPAAAAEVKANDIITHLDDESANGLTLNQAVEKMRGPPNTKIKLKIIRKGQENPIELSVTRAIIQVRSKEVQK
jgi:hypothetical protein